MKVTAVLILAGLAATSFAALPAQAQSQQCSVGSFPALDGFGNWVCKRADGSVASTQVPRGQECPIGAHPAMDNLGNKVCRSDATVNRPQTDYYDTSKGCPIGTMPAMDTYGNQVCKKF